MDIFLLIFIILVSIALLISNIYILAYYCHPDDKGFGSALICKIVVVLGMTLAWAQVLMLPLDVANNRSFGGGLNMQIFWEIVYITTAIMVVVIIPSLSAYYESDPDDSFVNLYFIFFIFFCEKISHSFCCFIVDIPSISSSFLCSGVFVFIVCLVFKSEPSSSLFPPL